MDSVFRSDLLSGKTALVTGGATGINNQIVRGFLKHKCKVCIISRKIANIEKAINELRRDIPGCFIEGKTCDVRKPQDVEEAVKFSLEKMGSIDILVNGAAGNFLASFDNLSVNAFKTVMEIDAFGTFIVSKAVFTHAMKKNGGVIINISAGLHYNGTALQLHAGTAKAGVDAMTKHMAVELGPYGVRVVGICPGPIADTEGFSRLSSPKANSVSLKDVLPLKMLGKKEDIANASLFLASDAAKFITGTILVVDGGQHLTFPNFPFSDPQFVQNYARSKL